MVVILKDPHSVSNFKDYSLVLPSVGVGNVGQLAIDLLISTLETKKIGIVHHPAILPLVGSDPYNPSATEPITSADLHICVQHKLLIIQIRSPLVKEEKDDFLQSLLAWIKEIEVKDFIVLASCNAFERWDHSQMTGPQLRYLTVNCAEEDVEKLKSIGPGELEERSDELGNKHRFFSGSGFIKDLIGLSNIPLISLFIFCDEGDNSVDAQTLLNYFNAWKKLLPTQKVCWKVPFSWKNMFGAPAPLSIY